jgi:hypothetical protein
MSTVIITTGMHRSGTSLISSLVQRAGIHIGEKLLVASSANPRGFFEDVDFFEFHDQLLHERGQTYVHIDRDFTFEPTAMEAEHARQLLAARSHRPVWGWKDPRTSLFLPFWQQLLPDAHFLFVYRHPIDVLLSLLRRGEFDTHPSFMAGLNAWHIYNSNILAIRNQCPNRCMLVNIDGVVKQPATFFDLLQRKLHLDAGVDPKAFDQIFHANELQKTSFPPELGITLAKLYPGLLELYQQLDLLADLPGDEIQTDPAASPYFSALAHFAKSLAEPLSLPVQHSLLQLLLWLLAPEPTAKILARFNQSTREMQLQVDQLWLHSQHIHRVSIEQRQELECLQRLNAEQSQTLESLQWLNMEQCQELEGQAVRIESLLAELTSIRDTRVWKAIQSYQKFKERWKKAA